ncbi:MAG: DoxX family membrane protein [Actinophytocola sp.]|uniref:DoxX family membrane protein n=1 Tax=Actinophytocola sp. TaxID=1872138 RepID=UPI0013273842|nr:DoxX family membrane protein [Actinophytocola sp.]MPZ80236.1 DoxX family membrane protein [Actinophytocola sp.]
MTTTQQRPTYQAPQTETRPNPIDRAETALIGLAGRIGLPALRVSLAVTFLWFGALKITNDTPVAEFVANTVNWIPGVEGSWFVPFLGVVEVLLGAALLFGKGLRVVFPLLFAHLTGTFLALFTQPDVTFQGGNPVMLTTEGEFVIKNLILLGAILVLYGLQGRRKA